MLKKILWIGMIAGIVSLCSGSVGFFIAILGPYFDFFEASNSAELLYKSVKFVGAGVIINTLCILVMSRMEVSH